MGRIAFVGTLVLLLGLALPLAFLTPAIPGTVVVASAPLTSLDPREISKADDLRLFGALFEGLTRLDPLTGAPRPALAKAWHLGDEGRTWTFFLSPNTRWSDGTSVTPAQVLAGLEYHRQEGSSFSELLEPLTRMTVDGDRLVLTCRRPVPDLAARLALPVFAPRHPANTSWADPTRLIGNGPLVCTGWALRHRVDLTANPAYTGPHPAQGPVRLRIVGDPATALRLYLDGQIDVIPSLSSDTAGALRDARIPGLQQTTGWGTEIYRVRAGALSPAAAARLSAAIDRPALVRDLLHGFGTPAHRLIPTTESAPSAGSVGGELPPLDLLIPAGRPDRLRVAEHLVDAWHRRLGATVRVVTLPATEVAARERTRTYDLSRGSLLGDTPDPLGFLVAFTSSSGMNRTGWSDTAYDALVEAAAPPGPDRAQRLRVAEDHLLHAGVIIPLYHYAALMLVRPGVTGATANAWEMVHLGDLGRK